MRAQGRIHVLFRPRQGATTCAPQRLRETALLPGVELHWRVAGGDRDAALGLQGKEYFGGGGHARHRTHSQEVHQNAIRAQSQKSRHCGAHSQTG